MAFKENQRIEQIYFSALKKNIDALRKWKTGETDLKTADVLDALINADSALLLLYKNLGEAYAETVSMIEAEKAALEALRADVESFKTSINGKIDEVNSYLLSLIRSLEERVDELSGRVSNIEHTLSATNRTKIFYIDEIDQDQFTIYDWNTDEAVSFEDIYNYAGSGFDLVLQDMTKDPNIYASLLSFNANEIVFERTYTIRANLYQFMTYNVTYRINDQDETYYHEDIYDVEEPGNLLNLKAVKQPNNYYQIYFPYDDQNAIPVLSLVQMAANGKELRVCILNNGASYFARLSYVNPTRNQSGEVTGSFRSKSLHAAK